MPCKGTNKPCDAEDCIKPSHRIILRPLFKVPKIVTHQISVSEVRPSQHQHVGNHARILIAKKATIINLHEKFLQMSFLMEFAATLKQPERASKSRNLTLVESYVTETTKN